MDAFINPVTADYLVDPDRLGRALTRDPAGGLANAIYLRIMIPLGSYWAAPELGSMLHTLSRQKDVARVAKLARQYVETALQDLIDDGRASSIEVETERLGDGRLRLQGTVVDARGQPLGFEHYIQVL